VFLIDKNGLLSAYLPTSAATEEPRKLDPFALPDWEPAFAMTIHKSQGSEYESVLVILPETQRPFISWELVYTAITRAKQEVTLVLPKKILGQHLPRTRRVSGLIHELDAEAAVKEFRITSSPENYPRLGEAKFAVGACVCAVFGNAWQRLTT